MLSVHKGIPGFLRNALSRCFYLFFNNLASSFPIVSQLAWCEGRSMRTAHLLYCSKNQRTPKRQKQLAVSSRKHPKISKKNEIAVTGPRAKKFYSPRETLTDRAKLFSGPHEVILRPARRNKVSRAGILFRAAHR